MSVDTVTTAIVGFIFVCIVMPHLVKNKPQFYIALAIVLVALVLRSIATMVGNDGFWRFVNAFSIFLEACCILLLVLATGGITARELAGEMGRAYEVMRRGETEKTVIVPLTGQQPRRRDEDDLPAPPPRIKIDKKGTDEDSIPLE